MALLENLETGKVVILRSHHIIGRRWDRVDTTISSDDVSQIHATIRWEGNRWTIVDHSKNGTWVDNKALVSGYSISLNEDNSIRFGNSPNSTWKVSNIDAPTTQLVPLHKEGSPLELQQNCVLSDEGLSDLIFFVNSAGRWVCESERGQEILSDNDIVKLGDKSWRFCCPAVSEITTDTATDGQATPIIAAFHFNVSLDEEHVFLNLSYQKKYINLGERVHHYLLLTLARHRLRDERSGLDESSQGWIELEQLSKMLGVYTSYLNIQAFRARKQIAQALPGVAWLPQVIERRVSSMRFGHPYFKIVRGSMVEGEAGKPAEALA